MSRLDNGRQRGFTLISLLITLGVIAITMAIGGPALWEIAYEIKLKNAARETISGMRAARYRAINESRDFGFSAAPGELPRIFEGDDPTDLTATVRDIPMAGGVGIASSDFGADNDTFVVFAPDGSADNTGTIVLANANNHSITVTVSPASTARMKVSKIQ